MTKQLNYFFLKEYLSDKQGVQKIPFLFSCRPIISSASTERILHWSMPDGERVKEIAVTDISINCISVNPQGALVAAGMSFHFSSLSSIDVLNFFSRLLHPTLSSPC